MIRTLVHRLTTAIGTRPKQSDWHYGLVLLGLYSVIYLPIGFATGFLTLQPQSSIMTILGVMAGALITPGLTEELVFRVLLIPHRTEPVKLGRRWLWVSISLVAFVLYHPFNPFAQTFFSSPIFLLGAALLGLICSLSYLKSGSLWTAMGLHWIIVIVWLLLLGGLAKF
jgi:predicted Abi (CAAX) family protease